jgi:hypothetical protein
MRPISGAWIVVCFTSACLSGFTADEAASSSSPPPNDRSATPVGGGDDRMATASEGDMPSAVPFTDEQDEETPPVMPADSLDAPRPPIELTDIDQAMRVVTWGSTALTYEYHPGNLRLLANVLAAFSSGSPVERRGRFLYTSGCDPRQDADYCGAESFVEVKPFLDAVGLVGTIEFRPAGAVQVGDYAGIIVDACEPNAWDAAPLVEYLNAGGRLLILGDNFCWSSGGTSASIANGLLELASIGIRFSDLDPAEPRFHEVSVATGLLQGVESMRVFRYTPQSIESGIDAVLVTSSGIVIARDVH